jgi:hypothetical protein
MPAGRLYSPPSSKQDYVLTKHPHGSSKAMSHAQGSLTLLLKVTEANDIASTMGTMRTTASMGMTTGSTGVSALEPTVHWGSGTQPQRWFALHMVKAEKLIVADLLGKSDPYALILWKRRERFTTAVLWRTLNPVWKQRFMLPFDEAELNDGDIEARIMIYDKDVVGTDEFLGQVVLRPEQLVSGSRGVVQMTLEGRPDVPADAGVKDRGSVFLSFRMEEEVPFSRVLSDMQLALADPYAALEVMGLELDPEALPDGTPAEEVPQLFVKLSCGPVEIAQTACVEVSRNGASFFNELFVFPLARALEAASTVSVVRKFAPDTPLQLSVYGVFPKVPVQMIGRIELQLKEFGQAPPFRTRHTLARRSGSGFMFGAKADAIRLTNALGKSSLVLRRALVPLAVPRPFTCELEEGGRVPRLRLEIFGVCCEPDPENCYPALEERTLSLDLVFCGDIQRFMTIPFIEQPTQIVQRAFDATSTTRLQAMMPAKEYVLPFGAPKLRDVSLLMLVSQEVQLEGGGTGMEMLGEVSEVLDSRGPL